MFRIAKLYTKISNIGNIASKFFREVFIVEFYAMVSFV